MKRTASLSLDLDNQWSYMKTHGDAGWKDFPSYLDRAVPQILEILERKKLKITFFIVGQDAALDKNHGAIRSIADAGHEIGNHSFSHEPWLHLYSKQEIAAEFERTEDALDAIGVARPVGFRGPGFSLSPMVVEVLGERDYQYDCSTLPTYIAPLARAFFFLKSPNMSSDEREKLRKLYGSFADGMQTLRPHKLAFDLVEIPVTTFPLIKTPIHATYLNYLATISPAIARLYWRSALAACSVTGLDPSFLLHPLDFLSGDDVPDLKFFPGMSLPTGQKLEFIEHVLDKLTQKFEVVTMREHAARYRNETLTASRPSSHSAAEPHRL
ncbi:MAG: polysaccharide deacetylase family protein [Pyrinomonadaceae bacterium]